LLWVANPISIKDFIGISQIEKYFKGNYDSGELDEKLTLKIEGAFKFVRHPIYLFSILFLAFRPSMDLFYLTTLICVIIYFYIGSIYEEKKLVEVFGNDYLKYQQNVPRLIPWKKKRSNKEQK
jgi:protein-S-isoprenylcysteine O-methyltransferase Ste14